MLICHLTESFAGGVSKHITDLINHCDSYQHVLIYSSERTDIDNERIRLLENKIQVFRLNMCGLNALFASKSLNKILKKISPDVLHAHSSFAGITSRINTRNINYKVIYTPHGFAFLRTTDIYRPVYGIIEYILSKKCDKIIAVSKSEKLCAINYGIDEEKMVVIENGIAENSLLYDRNDIRKEWGILPDEIVISTLGRPGQQKGYDILKTIIEKVSLNSNNLKLHFIVPMNADYKRTKHIISPSVVAEYVPAIHDTNILLAVSDIYISTARWEGGPYGVLEAMQFGLPVIVSDVSGNSDYVINNKTGYIIPLSVNDYVDKLVELSINPELRSSFGDNGKTIINECFSINSMINKYDDLISLL